MGFTSEQYLNIGGVLLVVFGVMLLNNVAAMLKRRRPGPVVQAGPAFIGKYAQHEGSIVGKVIAIEGDHLLIEQSGMTRQVAVSQAKDVGHDVILTGDIGPGVR